VKCGTSASSSSCYGWDTLRPEVHDLLTKEQPKTIVHAERICEEYEARQRLKPVTSRFVAVMAPADNAPKAAVGNLVVRGGYRGPKARGRGQTRGGGQQRRNSGGNQPRQPSALTCFRCGKQGHIAQECRAPASAIISQPGTRGQGRLRLHELTASPRSRTSILRCRRRPNTIHRSTAGTRCTYRNLKTQRSRGVSIQQRRILYAGRVGDDASRAGNIRTLDSPPLQRRNYTVDATRGT
jgi:hypothetical protein